MWLSTTKYFSPSFSYTVPPCWRIRPAPTWLRRCGRQVKAQILRGILRVGEEQRPVVQVDHPAVVRRHVLLELGGVEEAGFLAESLGDLVVVDLHVPGAVHAHHGR